MEILTLWRILWRRRWIFLATFGLILGSATILAFVMPSVYEYKSKIIIKHRDLNPRYVNNDLPADLGKFTYASTDLLADTFWALIESRPVADAVVKKLDLKDSKGNLFDPKRIIEPGFMKKCLTQKIALEAEQIEDSELFEIRGYASDPQLAVNMANAFADEFINLHHKFNKEDANTSLAQLEKEAARLKTELTAEQERIISYRQERSISDINTQRSNLLSVVNSLKTAALDSDRSIRENDKSLSEIKKAIGKTPEFQLSQKAMSPMIRDFRSKLYEIELDAASRKLEITENHPDMRALREKMEYLKGEIKKDVEKILASETISRNSYYDALVQRYGEKEIENAVLSVRLAVMEAQRKGIQKELDDLTRKEEEYTAFTVKYIELKDLYKKTISNIDLARVARDMNVKNVQMVERAEVSKTAGEDYRYFPDRKLILIIAFAIGLVAAFAVVLLLEHIDTTFRTGEEVERGLNLPVLAVIPRIKGGAALLTDVSRRQ